MKPEDIDREVPLDKVPSRVLVFLLFILVFAALIMLGIQGAS